MTQSFRCPSCSAPLKYNRGRVQTCRFCDTDVVAPIAAEPQEKSTEVQSPIVETERLRDASALGEQAIKIAEIKHSLRENRKVSAAVLFRDNFGGSIADAREIIEAIEKGENVCDPRPGAKPAAGENAPASFSAGEKPSRAKMIGYLVDILAAAAGIFLLLTLAKILFPD